MSKAIRYLTIILLVSGGINIYSQESILDKSILLTKEELMLEELIKDVSHQAGVKIAYSASQLNISQKVVIRNNSFTVDDFLKLIKDEFQVGHKLVGSTISLYPLKLRPSTKIVVSGFVTDSKTGEKLIGANVYNANTNKGVVTNNYGFFSFSCNESIIQLTISYVGYSVYTRQHKLKYDTVIDVSLIASTTIDEVIVESSDKTSNVYTAELSTIRLPLKTVKNIPVVFGEADIIKSLQLLPGVQSGSEAMSGMYVRGGGTDQNLVLLDGVPVYNENHLFGFFSVFNSDAIQNVELTKGAFPARYGGRLSSVLDISMKEGNRQKFGGTVSLGLISSKFLINGPINNKTSFLLSARRTYADILAAPFLKAVERNKDYDKYKTGYYFYDINAKVNHRLNRNNHVFFSLYTGKDKYYKSEKQNFEKIEYNPDAAKEWPHLDTLNWSLTSDAEMWWSNITAALRWNYIVSNKLYVKTTATYSWYKMENMESSVFNYSSSFLRYNSHIEDFGVKLDVDYFPSSNHNVKFGIAETYHTFNPGVTVHYFTNANALRNNTTTNHKQYAHELGVYIEDDINIGKRIKTNVGLRWSGFKVGDAFYWALEPRISTQLLLTNKWSLKGAFAQMNQYVNLLVNSNIGLPFDLWVPATDKIQPQESNQMSLGSAYSINKSLDFTIEGFHKKMDNLIEYREGASFISASSDWQTKVTQGEGWAYGVEALLMKRRGKTTGWLGYTLSKSERRFNRTGKEISFGKVFPYKYDRRHDISLVVSHQLNKKINISGTWVYGTGNAVTLAYIAYPSIDQHPHREDMDEPIHPNIEYIEKRNNFRIPPYHRLDVGINLKKEKRWGLRTWNISVYNVYNRQNPFMVEWDISPVTNEKRLMQYSLFQIMPSISYTIDF